MNQKAGSFLLEVVVGTLIASMITGVLMNTLSHMTKMSALVDGMANQVLQLTMIQHQFERDVSGMCVVHQAIIEEKEEQLQNKKQNGQNEDNQAIEKNQNKAKSDVDKTKQAVPRLKKVFFVALGQENQMQQISFITNNPLPSYWHGTVGNAKPLKVRVVYFLKPDPQHQGSFILMRQESSNLLLDSFKDTVTAYEIADHIASFSLMLSYDTIQKEEKSKDAKSPMQSVQSNKPKTTIATVAQWDSDELLSKDNEYYSLLPRAVTVEGQFWSSSYRYKEPFKMTIPVAADGFNAVIKHKPKAPEKTADQSKQEDGTELSEKNQKHTLQQKNSTKSPIAGLSEVPITLADASSHMQFPMMPLPAWHAPLVEFPAATIELAE